MARVYPIRLARWRSLSRPLSALGSAHRAMKVRTTSVLVDALDHAGAWRKREILDLKILIATRGAELDKAQLRRAAVLILYASRAPSSDPAAARAASRIFMSKDCRSAAIDRRIWPGFARRRSASR